MNYGLTSAPSLNASNCLVIGVLSNHILPEFATIIDEKHHGLITRLCNKLQENGDTAWQADVDGSGLLLVDCGDQTQFNADNLSKRLTDISTHLLKERITSATIAMPQLDERSANWQIRQMLLHIEFQRYQFLDFKSRNTIPYSLESIVFFHKGATHQTIETAQNIAKGICLTRNLANMPANVCTPTYLGQQALELAKHHEQLQSKVLNPDEIRALGMGALLAVAQGSSEPPQFIEIQYHGTTSDTPPVVLVGKGITFDSGGLSLKPADAMCEMKYDMAGAASVLGTLKACALLKLPINVVGLIASAENMLSGTAIKPGDVITSMSGQTVEIINTDAEGRLILADALTYAERFNPRFVIDVATLTGAVIVALGNINTGFMTNDEDLAHLIETAARESVDKVWRLPLDKDYQEALDSPVADLVNATFDRTAGSITAACFLSRFTAKYRWAHLDIAGTAWISGKKRNATGRPVPLLIQLLSHVAHSR